MLFLKKQMGVIAVLAGLLVVTGCARMNRPSTVPTPDGAPPADTARVYFVMPVVYPAGEVFVLHEQKLVGYLTNRQWFYMDVPAGKQMFMTVSENTTVVEGELEGGKSYWVKNFVTPGFAKTRVYTAILQQGTEDWDARKEWLSSSKHMELVPESAAKWEAKYAKNNEKRQQDYEAGKYEVLTFTATNVD